MIKNNLISDRIRTGAFGILGSNFLLSLRARRIAVSNALTIVNLHRVDDRKTSTYRALHPKIFSELVGYLKKNFEIVNFSDLVHKQNDPARKKPQLIISFDDGYKDFIEIVAPILDEHGISVNQNVIPQCMESGRPPMNVVMQDFLDTAPASLIREIKLSWIPQGFDPDNREKSGLMASRALKGQSYAEQLALFGELIPQIERFDSFKPTPMMTNADVRQVSAAHEIGAHSWEHASMESESNDYFKLDFLKCQDYFSKNLQCPLRIYAFPNGSHRAEQVELLHQNGVDHVLLTGDDFSSSRLKVHKRFNTYGTSLPEARFRAIGGTRKMPRAQANLFL